ncbi:hypothetical protein MASR2M70_06430 [Bacillota bacterium]
MRLGLIGTVITKKGRGQGVRDMGAKAKSKNNVLHKTAAILAVFLLVAGLLISPINADSAFAAENIDIKISQTGGYFAVSGDTGVNLTMRVENKGKTAVTFTAKTGLSKASGAIMEPNPASAKTTLEPGAATDILFLLDIAKTAKAESYSIPVILTDGNDGNIIRSRNLELSVIKKALPPGASGDTIVYTPAFDLAHKLSPTEAIKSGSVTDLTLTFINSGNTTMKSALVTLGLPDGITINNGSNSLAVGYVSIGDTKSVNFSLMADDKIETKNYPFTVDIAFKDNANAGQSIKQTIYIPVEGSGEASSLSGVVISDINMPGQAAAGEDFTLSFKVSNKGNSGTGQVKIFAEPQAGIVNRTQNAFIEKNIPAGESRSYSVTFFTADSAQETSYTIKLAAEPLSGKGDSVQQYSAVYIKNTGTDSIKTPQLMISSYNYGGSFVQAGDEFRLDLELKNTSSSHNLRNIKVTLESNDGTFIPVRSSNSFFIDRIGKGESVGHTIFLSVKPDAEQKTTSLNISMSYEDTGSNAFTATDIVSIPVMQDTRLVVDDIIAPPELYVGMQTGISVNFYNMGKTKLNNLKINAEGNFDTMESNSYYAGNVAPGTEDSYDFSFMPRELGPMQGKIIFSYEDASGDQQTFEKEFEFQIMEMPVWEDENLPPEDMNGEKKIPWLPIGIVAAISVAAAIVLILRHRKKKMQREMEIDE